MRRATKFDILDSLGDVWDDLERLRERVAEDDSASNEPLDDLFEVQKKISFLRDKWNPWEED